MVVCMSDMRSLMVQADQDLPVLRSTVEAAFVKGSSFNGVPEENGLLLKITQYHELIEQRQNGTSFASPLAGFARVKRA